MKTLPDSLSQLATLHDYDPDSMPVEQARQLIQHFVQPLSGIESVPLHLALHRALAQDVVSPMNVPPHDNSAMDGYALRFADLENGTTKMKVAGNSFAGHPYTGTVAAATCVRIMTGALIPNGCDTVVMQEHVKVDGDSIEIGGKLRPGQNVRRAGEDIRQGSTVLERGQLIRAAEMGLLASLGLGKVAVFRQPRVALFSTGDELKQAGEPLAPGQIYDSNRYTLMGMLQELGVDILDMGHIRDDRDSLKQSLTDAAQQADVIITSGGVSVGEADYVKELLSEIGEMVFWKLAMKPGRPLVYGRIGACHFFGLPGNPVAAMVAFRQFVRDVLQILMGQAPKSAQTFRATCLSPLKKVPGRTEFQRGILSRDANGELVVHSVGDQGSGILSSMSRANCFIVLPMHQGNVEAGTGVEVQPF